MMVIVLLLVICSSDVAYVFFCLVRRSDSRCPVLSLGQVARDALFVFLWSGGYGCPIIVIYLVRWLLLSRDLFAWRRGSGCPFFCLLSHLCVPIFGLDGQVVLGVFFVAFVWWGRTLALDARTSQKGTLPKIRRR